MITIIIRYDCKHKKRFCNKVDLPEHLNQNNKKNEKDIISIF
jgi:hypothetical protein